MEDTGQPSPSLSLERKKVGLNMINSLTNVKEVLEFVFFAPISH